MLSQKRSSLQFFFVKSGYLVTKEDKDDVKARKSLRMGSVFEPRPRVEESEKSESEKQIESLWQVVEILTARIIELEISQKNDSK
jgi:hypothetical protein